MITYWTDYRLRVFNLHVWRYIPVRVSLSFSIVLITCSVCTREPQCQSILCTYLLPVDLTKNYGSVCTGRSDSHHTFHLRTSSSSSCSLIACCRAQFSIVGGASEEPASQAQPQFGANALGCHYITKPSSACFSLPFAVPNATVY